MAEEEPEEKEDEVEEKKVKKPIDKKRNKNEDKRDKEDKDDEDEQNEDEDEPNEEDQKSKNLITVENADFSNKNKLINSPRSLKACQELGILPIELYKLSLDEYKNKNKTSFTLEQKMLKMRYDGYDKFRKDSIILVKKKREALIDNEKNKLERNVKKSKSDNTYIAESLKKMKEEERKELENLKNQHKHNIINLLETRVNEDILKRLEKKNEWRQLKKEEYLKKIKKENEESSEQKKIMDIQNRKEKEDFRLKLKEKYEQDEEMKKKKQLNYDINQRKYLEENEKFLKKKEELREKMEKNLEDLRMKIEKKDKITDVRIQLHLENKERQLEAYKRKNLEKQNKIWKNLELNEKERNNELNLIIMHQDCVDENVNMVKLRNKEKIMKQSEYMSSKYAVTLDNRNKIEEEKRKKIMEMQERLKQSEKKLENKKKEDEEIIKQKIEERKIKDIEREIVKERKKRIEMLEKEKKMREMEEKDKKVKEILECKNQLKMEREMKKIKLMLTKEQMNKQFVKLQNQEKEIDNDDIKELFPDDSSFLNKILEIKEWQKDEINRRKLKNYENDSVNFSITTNNNFNNSKIFKPDKSKNLNIEDTEENDYEDNNPNKTKKETFITSFNNKVRELNKNLKKINNNKTIIESERYSFEQQKKNENQINFKSLRSLKNQKDDKNKKFLIPMSIQRSEEKEKEKEKENEIEKERDKSKKSNYTQQRSKPKNIIKIQSKIAKFVEFNNYKLALPEISDYRKTKNKSTSRKKLLDTKKKNGTSFYKTINIDGIKFNESKDNRLNTINNDNHDKTINNINNIADNSINNINNEQNKTIEMTKNGTDELNNENNKNDKDNKDNLYLTSLTIDINEDKDIENKINEYKLQLNNNFMKVLEEGKKADEQRTENIQKEIDPLRKRKLEQESMQEKKNLAKRLKEIKEDMEIKILAYEKKLTEKKLSQLNK